MQQSEPYLVKAGNPRTQTEVFIESWPEDAPYIYESNRMQSLPYELAKVWTQVFDLGDTQLIVSVQDNEILLKLFQLTEEQINKFYGYVQTNLLKLPADVARSRGFSSQQNKNNEQEKELLREYFTKHSAVKMRVDGQVVRNLSLNPVFEIDPTFKSQGAEVDQNRYILSFITSTAVLYEINLDKFFLRKDESVSVREKYLGDQIQDQISTFELYHDKISGENTYIVGTTKNYGLKELQNKNLVREAQIQSLNFIRQQRGNFELQAEKPRDDTLTSQGLLKTLVQGFKQAVTYGGAQLLGMSQNSTGKNLANDESQRIKQQKQGWSLGVVSLRRLSNQLVAAIYSTGVLKIWSVNSGQRVLKYNLLGKNGQGQLNQGFKQRRIFEAKIESASQPFNLNSRQKAIKIAVAFGCQDSETFQCSWTIEHMELSFENLPVGMIDSSNHELVDLNQICSLDNTVVEEEKSLVRFVSLQRKQIQTGTEVQDIQLEADEFNSHLWMISQNQNNETQIEDFLDSNYIIHTKNAQEKNFQMLDDIELREDILYDKASPLKAQLQNHYYQRLSLDERFTERTIIKELLKFGIKLEVIQRNGVQRVLKQFCTTAEVEEIQKLLASLSENHLNNCKAYSLSRKLNDFPFRMVLRPLGICLLKIDSAFSTLQSRSLSIVKRLQDILNMNTQEQMTSSLQAKDQLSGIQRQQLEQEYSSLRVRTGGDIMSLLFASMELLHKDSLLSIDVEIIKKEGSIVELMNNIVNNSRSNSIIHNLTLNLIDASRVQIQYELKELIFSLISYFLNEKSMHGGQITLWNRAGFKNKAIPDEKFSQYSPKIAQFIIQSTQLELQNLQNLLRNIFLLQLYISKERPSINFGDLQRVYEDQIVQSQLSFWLKQLTVITYISSSKIKFEELDKNSQQYQLLNRILRIFPSIELKKEGNFMQQQFLASQFNRSKEISVLSYLLGSIQEVFYHNSSLINNHFDLSLSYSQGVSNQMVKVDLRTGLFGNILVAFVQKYCTQSSMQPQTFIPKIAKMLYRAKSFEMLNLYLSTISDRSNIACEIFQAILAAVFNNSPQLFLEHMSVAISKYNDCLISQKANFEPFDFIPLKKERVSVAQRLSKISNNSVTLFYLILLELFQKQDERYSLFIIKSALLEKNITDILLDSNENKVEQERISDRDYFYHLMFQKASARVSPDCLYLACTQIKNTVIQRSMVGQFFDYVLNCPDSQHLIFSQYFFTQELVDRALDYLAQRAIEFLEQPGSRFTKALQDIRINVTRLIKTMHIVSQLYDRQPEISRFLWFLQREVERRVQTEFQGDLTADRFSEILKLKEIILLYLYQNAVYLGEHLFITDSQSQYAVTSDSKKRRNEEMSGNKRDSQGLSVQDSEKYVQYEGFNALKFFDVEKMRGFKFIKGHTKLVTIEDILKEIHLTEGRLKISSLFNTRDEDQIMRILVEMKDFELAIVLAQAFNLDVGYPLSFMLSSLSGLEESIADAKPRKLSVKVQANQIQKASKLESNHLKQISKNIGNTSWFKVEFETFSYTLNLIQMIQLVENLVAQMIQVPESVERALVINGLTKSLIESYAYQPIYCKYILKLIGTYPDKAISDLYQSDPKLLAYILDDAKSFIQYFEQAISEDMIQIDQNTASLEKRRQNFKQQQSLKQIGNQSMIQEISDFLKDQGEFVTLERIDMFDPLSKALEEEIEADKKHFARASDKLDLAKGVVRIIKQVLSQNQGL